MAYKLAVLEILRDIFVLAYIPTESMINMQSYNPAIILSERSSTMDIIHT